MNVEEKIDKLRMEVGDLKSRLDSHLTVADFVDGNVKVKLEEVKANIKLIEVNLRKVVDYVTTQKAEKSTVKTMMVLMSKIVGIISVAGGVLYSLFKAIVYLSKMEP